jgi:hypothetical protein
MHRLASISSIYMEGSRVAEGYEATIRIIKEQGKLFRTETVTETGNRVSLVTAEEGWTFSADEPGSAARLTTEEFARSVTELDIAGPLVDYISKGHRAVLLGKELIADNSCYKVSLVTKDGLETLFWIDKITYLVTRSSNICLEIHNSTSRNSFTIYNDYRNVDGVMFPFTFHTVGSNKTQPQREEKTIYSQVLLNQVTEPGTYIPGSLIKP